MEFLFSFLAEGSTGSEPEGGLDPIAIGKKILEWAKSHYGWTGVVVVSIFGVPLLIWLNWEKISKLPGVSSLVSFISRERLPKADPNKFSVAIVHLDNDDKGETERILVEALREFPGTEVLQLDRLVKDSKQAHDLLSESRADVLIWGTILRNVEQSLPKLHWTPAREGAIKKESERYRLTEDLNLPELFWNDLTEVLGLLVATGEADFSALRGQFVADKLKVFIERVRNLLGAHASRWNPEARAQVHQICANSLVTYGEQTGTTEPLEEAVAAYREALKERTRERVPLDWAMTQNNLGTALRCLGERESGTQRLEQAVATYREALKEYTRERFPLGWAMTQNNLGNALGTLGERESGKARLEEAVAAYREALKEYTRERVPLDWAMTQNNLGNALSALGERESGTGRLEEAVAAYREALKEYTRERVPLNWAGTQNNLGTVLLTLGERESGTGRLEEAVAAHREALKEYTRARVPLDWAMTQNNLGNALGALGERESGTQRLEEAVAAFREALKERTRQRVPLDWAITQKNLGNALRILGERESGTARLEEAVQVYGAALEVFRSAGASYYLQRAENSVKQAKEALERRKNQSKSSEPPRRSM